MQIRNEITNCETTGLGNRLLRQKTRPFTSPVHFPPIADPKFSEVKWSTQILLFSSSWSTVWNEIFHRIASRFNCLQAPPTTTTTPFPLSYSPPPPPAPSFSFAIFCLACTYFVMVRTDSTRLNIVLFLTTTNNNYFCPSAICRPLSEAARRPRNQFVSTDCAPWGRGREGGRR